MAAPTVYPKLNALLEELVSSVRAILGANFCGAYLQGSFAVGDADVHSDVDFIVATRCSSPAPAGAESDGERMVWKILTSSSGRRRPRRASATGRSVVTPPAMRGWPDVCRALPRPCLQQRSKGGAMYHWMDGWGWFWMTFMMLFWIVVLGAVVYVAVKLADRPPTDPKSRA